MSLASGLGLGLFIAVNRKLSPSVHRFGHQNSENYAKNTVWLRGGLPLTSIVGNLLSLDLIRPALFTKSTLGSMAGRTVTRGRQHLIL